MFPIRPTVLKIQVVFHLASEETSYVNNLFNIGPSHSKIVPHLKAYCFFTQPISGKIQKGIYFFKSSELQLSKSEATFQNFILDMDWQIAP